MGMITQKTYRARDFIFFAEPQFWLKIHGAFSAGTKINMYYHVLTTESIFQAYPTLAIRCKL